MSTIPIEAIHQEWMKRASYREAYAALEEEFSLARELIKARLRAKLTQAQVAKKMGTTQSVVARLESGKRPPRMDTLERFAIATGSHLHVSFSPAAMTR
jgi:DNA-binding XRE family transcriptional regulator